MPVTQPSAGVGVSLVSSLWARAPNSTKLPASKSRLRRSRTVSLPAACCLLISSGPPNSRACFFLAARDSVWDLRLGMGKRGSRSPRPQQIKRAGVKAGPFLVLCHEFKLILPLSSLTVTAALYLPFSVIMVIIPVTPVTMVFVITIIFFCLAWGHPKAHFHGLAGGNEIGRMAPGA